MSPSTRVASPATEQGLARRDRLAPLLITGGAAVGVGLLAARDPNVSGSYGFCPFKAVTGLDCPFCGGLRGTYALLHGDVATALDHNVLVPLFLVGALVALWGLWRGFRWRWSAQPLPGRILAGAGISTLAVFWVLRNVPALEYLSSSA